MSFVQVKVIVGGVADAAGVYEVSSGPEEWSQSSPPRGWLLVWTGSAWRLEDPESTVIETASGGDSSSPLTANWTDYQLTAISSPGTITESAVSPSSPNRYPQKFTPANHPATLFIVDTNGVSSPSGTAIQLEWDGQKWVGDIGGDVYDIDSFGGFWQVSIADVALSTGKAITGSPVGSYMGDESFVVYEAKPTGNIPNAAVSPSSPGKITSSSPSVTSPGQINESSPSPQSPGTIPAGSVTPSSPGSISGTTPSPSSPGTIPAASVTPVSPGKIPESVVSPQSPGRIN